MRALLHTALGLAAFLGVSAGVRATIPLPEEFGLRAKLDYFREHADEFDAVFVGSSRVFRDVMPRVLERDLAEQGYELRAFNFGIGGMEDFEADHVLRQVLDAAGERLRWVFLEAGRWDARTEEDTVLMSKRYVEWHTLVNGRALVESILALDVSWMEQAELLQDHLALCAARLVAQGRGPDAWRAWRGEESRLAAIDRRNLSEAELDRDLGWQVVQDDGAGLEPANWRKQVKRLLESESQGTDAGRASLRFLPVAAIERQVEYVRERVPNLVYLCLPSHRRTTFARTLARLEIYPVLLDYSLPSEVPELYELESRVDSNHLNEVGATSLTRRLARDLEPLLRAGD